MKTLKEILVDAARYRWIRENLDEVADWCMTPDDADEYIDNALSREVSNV